MPKTWLDEELEWGRGMLSKLGDQHVQRSCCRRQLGRFKELRDHSGWVVGLGRCWRTRRRGVHREAGNKPCGALSALLMILVFNLRLLRCHDRVLNSGLLEAELCLEKFILLLLSRE